MDRSCLWAVIAVVSASLAGCSSGPAEVTRAKEVIAERPSEDGEYHKYALSIMAGSQAPHARELIIEAISGGSRVAAAEAIRGLEGQADEETSAALRAAFSKGGAVKAQAAAVLAGAGDTAALEWLAGQLGQGGYVLPTAAMTALAGTEHDERVRTALRGLIWSKDLPTRNEGYAMLGAIRSPWSVPLLVEGLDKEFGQERVEPIVALGRAGDPSAIPLIGKWVNTQGLVLASLEALGRIGDGQAVGAIEPMLDHEQPVVRAYAAAAAWRVGARDAAMAVIPSLLSDGDPAARRALAAQLAGADGDEVTAWLIQLTGDDDIDARAEAYRGLVGRQGAGLAAAFAAGAQDSSYEVSTIALAGLAKTGEASHSAALGPLLESDNPYVAISAAHTVLELAGTQR